MPDYTGRLLAAFEAEEQKSEDPSNLSHCPAPDRAIEPTGVGSTPPCRAGTLEPRDKRAAFPRLEHGERAQSEDLRKAPGQKAHRSDSPRPRVGPVVVLPAHLVSQRISTPTTITQTLLSVSLCSSRREERTYPKHSFSIYLFLLEKLYSLIEDTRLVHEASGTDGLTGHTGTGSCQTKSTQDN